MVKTVLLLAVFGMRFQSASVAREKTPSRTSSRSLAGERCGPPRKKTKLSAVRCDRYASCAPGVSHENQCFCDRLCRVYGDCCADYVDEEDGHPLTPLPPRHISCSPTPGYPVPVYIITDCPATYGVQFVLDGCRRGSTSSHPPSNETFYVVPVSGRTSGLVYRNIYCALCHGEDDTGFWNVSAGYCAAQVTSTTVDDHENLMLQESTFVGGCSLFSFTPTPDVPEPRRCVNSRATFPSNADAELTAGCTRPSNVAYVYVETELNHAYRNRDCAACNGVDDYDLSCKLWSGSFRSVDIILSAFESFDIILDLNTGKSSTVWKESETQTLRPSSCPGGHVYDPFAGTCRSIACPPGTSFTESGQCYQQRRM